MYEKVGRQVAESPLFSGRGGYTFLSPCVCVAGSRRFDAKSGGRACQHRCARWPRGPRDTRRRRRRWGRPGASPQHRPARARGRNRAARLLPRTSAGPLDPGLLTRKRLARGRSRVRLRQRLEGQGGLRSGRGRPPGRRRARVLSSLRTSQRGSRPGGAARPPRCEAGSRAGRLPSLPPLPDASGARDTVPARSHPESRPSRPRPAPEPPAPGGRRPVPVPQVLRCPVSRLEAPISKQGNWKAGLPFSREPPALTGGVGCGASSLQSEAAGAPRPAGPRSPLLPARPGRGAASPRPRAAPHRRLPLAPSSRRVASRPRECPA
nr:uncharacterized protein LOC116280894 [Vicugna pacos]